jgi:hypothetical protein
MRYSVEVNASRPIAVRGLILDQLPISRQGATEFTFSRFLVPWLMEYEGIGLFCDEDMVVTGDIWELFRFAGQIEGPWDVAVMQDQERFEWPSVMLFNNKNLTHLTPEFVDSEVNALFDFSWAKHIAELPSEWNHCCGLMEPKEAKLYHWTQGIPWWTECRGLPEDDIWWDAYQKMNHSVQWIDLHAGTKHFPKVMERFLSGYGLRFKTQ